MKYQNILHGTFHSRPNRFIAKVYIDDILETVHVKNTGRCRELLLPGAEVILTRSDNPARKTKYDLIGVRKPGLGLVNLDSQAPNKVVYEWLQRQDYTLIRPEYTYGASRIDFYMERENERFLMEVKGCTLEIDGTGYFPDAPTERGIKHLQELARASREGFHCMLVYVIQMEGIYEVHPNITTHPQYGEALRQARQAGVQVLYLPCKVREDFLEIS